MLDGIAAVAHEDPDLGEDESLVGFTVIKKEQTHVTYHVHGGRPSNSARGRGAARRGAQSGDRAGD